MQIQTTFSIAIFLPVVKAHKATFQDAKSELENGMQKTPRWLVLVHVTQSALDYPSRIANISLTNANQVAAYQNTNEN